MIIETVAKRKVGACPYCGGEYEVTTFPKVDACATPKLAMKLVESNFLVTCPHCEKKSLVVYLMYYFDIERNIALVYSQYWQQAKKMAEEIVPVPIGKNGKRIKIKTFTQWFEFWLAICEYRACLKQRVAKANARLSVE